MNRVSTLTIVLALAATPALAQTTDTGRQPMSTQPTNVGPGDTHTLWSPSLPAPPVGPDAPLSAYVQAARSAVAAGRLGEAQEAIERAESRALTRSVRPSMASDPSHQPLVQQLAEARQMVAAHDSAGAARKLDEALANPETMASN